MLFVSLAFFPFNISNIGGLFDCLTTRSTQQEWDVNCPKTFQGRSNLRHSLKIAATGQIDLQIAAFADSVVNGHITLVFKPPEIHSPVGRCHHFNQLNGLP